MTNFRIQSVRAPNNDPRLAAAAVDALIRADAMGLLSKPVTCLDDSALAGLKVGMAEAGIDQTFLTELQRLPCIDPHGLSILLEKNQRSSGSVSGPGPRVARHAGRSGS